MRQIFDISAKLDCNDYALLESCVDNTTIRFIAYRPSDSSYFSFLTYERIFDGSDSLLDELSERNPDLARLFRYGWVLSASSYTIIRGISDMENGNQPLGSVRIVRDSMSIEDFMNGASEPISDVVEESAINDFISDHYTETTFYSGQHHYHYHHGVDMNKPIRAHRGHLFGIELEVEFDSPEHQRRFIDKKSNWFYMESDGSLGDYGTEIITIPLLPNDAKSVDFWQKLTSSLNHASSWDTDGRCGLHVHVSKTILGRDGVYEENLGKLLYVYHHHIKDTRLNYKIFGRERGYNDHDGKTREGDAVKLLGESVLRQGDVKERVKSAMIRRSDSVRYFDINTQNENTIEFRKGKGSINPERIAFVVEYCERLCLYVKSTPWEQLSYNDFVRYLSATATNPKLKELIDLYQ